MSTEELPALLVRGVTKSFGAVRALDGMDFSLAKGEIHALLGDNGAGKSTLIKVLSGVISPDEGSIEVDGIRRSFADPNAARAAGIETVYQDLALALTLTPTENIFLGREISKPGVRGRVLRMIDRVEMRRQVKARLDSLGVRLPRLDTPVSTLSGGQRQAVAIARAAVWGRQILILDEPTAALGVAQTEHVLQMVEGLRANGLSVIMITHSLPEVLRVADSVTVMRFGRQVLSRPIAECTKELLVAAMTGALEGISA